MNLLIGWVYGWWEAHHSVHYGDPNNLDKDPDMLRRQVIFAASELPVKGRSAVRRFIMRFQAVMFFALLGQEVWRLHAAGFRAVRAGRLARPVLELGLVVLHGVLLAGAAFLMLSPVLAVAFLLVSQTVFGFYLGAVFASSHKGMPVHRSGVGLDWLQPPGAHRAQRGEAVEQLLAGCAWVVVHARCGHASTSSLAGALARWHDAAADRTVGTTAYRAAEVLSR